MWSMPEAGPAMRPTVTTPTPWCQGWTTVSWILERVFPLYPIISLLFLDNAPISVGQNQIILPSRIHMSLLLESIQRLHTLAPVFLLLSQNKGCRVSSSLSKILNHEKLPYLPWMINDNLKAKFTCSLVNPFCQCPILPSQISQGYQLGDLHCCGFLYKYAKAAPQQTDMAWGQWPANCGSIA